MEKEQILDFTRSQSNRSGLTVINYEIIFAYLDDAKKAYQEEKWEEFKVALRKAQNSIGELMQTLDFSYDISRNLYLIYVFCRDSLAAAMYKRSSRSDPDRQHFPGYYKHPAVHVRSGGGHP